MLPFLRSYKKTLIAVCLACLLAGGLVLSIYGEQVIPFAQTITLQGWDYLQENTFLFYLALAILPAFGAPISPFYLAAPALHNGDLLPAFIGCSAALAINTSLGFGMAKGVGRPLCIHFLKKLGYTIPTIPLHQENRAIFLFRITPGLPFCVQNVVLGLAGVAYYRYILISYTIQFAWLAAFLTLGKSITKGNTGLIIAAILMIIALGVGIKMYLSHQQRKHQDINLP